MYSCSMVFENTAKLNWDKIWDNKEVKASYVLRHVKDCATDLEKKDMKAQTAQFRFSHLDSPELK